MKPYQVLHFINHIHKDYVTKESVKIKTAIGHYQTFYMDGYKGHLNLATALVENNSIENEKELIAMTFVQNLDYEQGEKGFGHIYENFLSLYFELITDRNSSTIKIPTSFNNSFVVKKEQCEQYNEAIRTFIEKITDWKHGESTEKVMSFEKSKMKKFNYYYEVKKKNSYKFHTDILNFIEHHPQLEINGVVFEFKLTSKNTAIINLYFGEKGTSLIGKI